MQSKGIIRRTEQALAFGLGLCWISWHAVRFGARRTREVLAEEAQHTSAAIRGRLEQLRGAQ
jgi:hypothetical protein